MMINLSVIAERKLVFDYDGELLKLQHEKESEKEWEREHEREREVSAWGKCEEQLGSTGLWVRGWVREKERESERVREREREREKATWGVGTSLSIEVFVNEWAPDQNDYNQQTKSVKIFPYSSSLLPLILILPHSLSFSFLSLSLFHLYNFS